MKMKIPKKLWDRIQREFLALVKDKGVDGKRLNLEMLSKDTRRELDHVLGPYIETKRATSKAVRERTKELVEEDLERLVLDALGVQTSEARFVSSRAKGPNSWDFDQ